MRKTRDKFRKGKLIFILIITAFAVSLFLIIKSIDNKIKPKVKEICTYYCKMQLSKMVNESVEEIILSNNINYSDIAVKLMDENKLSSVEIRTENVNKIQSQIINKIHEKLNEKSNNEISIPIGSVSDSYFLSGRGPEIKVKFLPEGTVDTELKSNFSSSGINQTCHTISIDIKAEAVVILPSESFVISSDSECILAESLIIGDVPFTNRGAAP